MNSKRTSLALIIPLTAAACFAALSYAQPAKAARPTSDSTSAAVASAGPWDAVLRYIIGPVKQPEICSKGSPNRAATKAVEKAASRIYR